MQESIMYFWRQLTCVSIVENWRCWCNVMSFLRLVISKGKFHLVITRGWRIFFVSLLPTEQCKCIWSLQAKRTMFKDRHRTSLSPSLLTPTRISLRIWSFRCWNSKAFYSCEFFVSELRYAFKSTWRESRVGKKEKWFRIMWCVAWCLVDLAVELCNHNPIKLATTTVG